MAQSNELEVNRWIVWKTELPFVNKPRRSSNFSLLGSEWYLRFSYNGNYHTIYIEQECSEEPLQSEFKVRTYIQHPVDDARAPEEPQLSTVKGKTLAIWISYYSDSVFKKLGWPYEYGEVKIVCLFYSVPASMIHVTTQTTLLSSVQENLDVPGPQDLESLSLDLSNLLEDKDFPDVKLQCGDRTFPAHRSILAARSEVFAAMFRNKMVERETGIVEVKDLDADVLELLLKYVYTGKFPFTSVEDTALSLYAAGDKYAIQPLKRASLNWIMRGVSEENCCRFFILADLHGSDDFKDAVVEFISSHKTVLEREDWLKFSEEHPKLVVEVYRNIYKNKN